MEYFLGAILTFLIVAITNRLVVNQLANQKRTVVRYSQSYIYSVVAPMMFGLGNRVEIKPTQSSKFQEESYIKVVIAENKAYWIKDNTFYTADLEGGVVDKDSTKEVDTMSMNDVELKKMMMIVETLREGNSNDSGGTRKP